ncbi:MAG: PilZ domain-containing protein [Methylocella sp.]
MTQDIPRKDHRAAGRQRALKQGKILFLNNLSIVDCTIRDLSPAGCKISCGDTLSVPSEFRLVTVNDNLIRNAKVMWRRGGQIGIQFTSEARRAPPRKL